MTIYITGDSWSSEGWPEGREGGYAPHECLGAQLQKITNRFVSVLAEPGDSDFYQFAKMEKRDQSPSSNCDCAWMERLGT